MITLDYGTKELAKADAVLSRITTLVPYPQIESTNNVFFDLMSCVIEQQIHYRSTKKTFEKLLQKAGLTRLSPHNFSQFEERALGGANLALSKWQTLEAVLTMWKSGEPDWFKLSDGEVAQILSSIPGIGQWTIDMILPYSLKRPNIVPYDDYHLKGLMSALYGLETKSPNKKQMRVIAEGWYPHQSLAVKYLFAYKATEQKAKKV